MVVVVRRVASCVLSFVCVCLHTWTRLAKAAASSPVCCSCGSRNHTSQTTAHDVIKLVGGRGRCQWQVGMGGRGRGRGVLEQMASKGDLARVPVAIHKDLSRGSC